MNEVLECLWGVVVGVGVVGCAVEHRDGSGTGSGGRRVRRGRGGERERKRRATGGWDIASPLARSDNHPKPLHNHPIVNNFAPPRSTNRTRSCVWSVRNTDSQHHLRTNPSTEEPKRHLLRERERERERERGGGLDWRRGREMMGWDGVEVEVGEMRVGDVGC